jgi:transposase-like protein
LPTPPPPQSLPEDNDHLPAGKKPRLQAPTSSSTGVVGVTAGLPDDNPTDSVTPATSLPSAAAYRRDWSLEEDAQLTKAVKKHGKDWVAVAKRVPGRTNSQCRSRWVRNLDPGAGKTTGRWKPEEDAKLIEGMKKHAENWVAVATVVPGRTDMQCRSRWVDKLNPANGGNKGKGPRRWTPDEDAKLVEAVKNRGKHWAAVATLVPGRTDGQCRQRWVDNLNPDNCREKKRKPPRSWEPDEDAQLVEAVKKYCKHWVAVATLVPGRTDDQCRKRWKTTYRASNILEEEHISGNEEGRDSAAVRSNSRLYDRYCN